MTDVLIDLIKDIELKVDLFNHQKYCIFYENLEDFNLNNEIKILSLNDSIILLQKTQPENFHLIVIESKLAQTLLLNKIRVQDLVENQNIFIFNFSKNANFLFYFPLCAKGKVKDFIAAFILNNVLRYLFFVTMNFFILFN